MTDKPTDQRLVIIRQSKEDPATKVIGVFEIVRNLMTEEITSNEVRIGSTPTTTTPHLTKRSLRMEWDCIADDEGVMQRMYLCPPADNPLLSENIAELEALGYTVLPPIDAEAALKGD